MAKRADPPPHPHSPRLRDIAAARGITLPSRSLAEVLSQRGRLLGTISDAGSRAVQEQRGERD